MATADIPAQNERANNFATDYAAATLTILDGATQLAVHTLTGFGAAASGVITANAIADDTILANGNPATSATLTNGTGTYTLTIGLVGSGADVEVNTLNYVLGETSSINSLTVTFPA